MLCLLGMSGEWDRSGRVQTHPLGLRKAVPEDKVGLRNPVVQYNYVVVCVGGWRPLFPKKYICTIGFVRSARVGGTWLTDVQ